MNYIKGRSMTEQIIRLIVKQATNHSILRLLIVVCIRIGLNGPSPTIVEASIRRL